MTGSRRALFVVALAVALAGVACGGGSSTSSSSPSAPSPSPSQRQPRLRRQRVSRCSPRPTTESPRLPVTPRPATPWCKGRHCRGVDLQRVRDGRHGDGLQVRTYVTGHGRTITKATLRLTVWGPPTEFPARPQLRLSAFAADWSPSAVTWNICTALACHAAGEALVQAPTANGPLDFDVTTIVANWASGTWNNYGLKLMVDQPAPGMMGRLATTWFYSLEYNSTTDERPKLIVEYQ